MGNEFGAADFQPHLIPALVYERVYDIHGSADDTVQVIVVAGGYHPKMRLRYASAQTVTEAIMCATTAAQMSVMHGSDEVVQDHLPTDNDVIGHYDELTIIDQFKDVEAADQVALYCSVQGLEGGAETGMLLVHLEYELVE